MEYERAASAHSFTSKSIYDGVFTSDSSTAAKKLDKSSRVEDYREIFYGSGSSIPVLDVPVLNERKVSVDVRSSAVDYSKVFGGFGNADFGVSYEDLFANTHNKGNAFSKIPAERRSPPQDSNPSNRSVENPILSHEASYQSFHGAKQFKMSYHKTNQGSKSGTNGTTHIAQLHAVPGYTCLVDELRATGDKPVSTALNDNLSGGIAEGNRSRKAVSDLRPNGASRQTSKGGVIYQNKINRSRSNSIDMLFDAHEIGLRTPPSGVPPPSSQLHNLSKNKGKSERLVASKFGFSKGHSSEGTASPGSPPYFDEEVDANSVAASSAAAVKKAIEEAQARIKIAKEIMERKKEGLQNNVKPNFNNGVKAEERRGDKIVDKANKFRKNKAQEICEEVDTPMQFFGGTAKQNAVQAGQVAPNFSDGEKLLADEEAPGETHGQKSKSAQADLRREEAEEWEATKQGENEKKMMQSVTDYEWEEKNMAEKSIEKIEEYNSKLKAVEEAHKQEEIGRVLDAVKGECELNECAKELESALDIHDQELRKSRRQEETEEKLKASYELEACEKKLKELPKPIENERKLETKEPKDDEILKRLKDDQENEKQWKEAHKQEENDARIEEVLETEENETNVEDISGQKENGKRHEEACEGIEFEREQKEARLEENVESEKQWKEAHKQEDNDTGLEDVPEREENEKNLEEISGQKENGKRHEEDGEGREFERDQKEACRLEENEVERNDVHSREDSEKRSDKVQGQDVIEVVLNDFHDGEESEESFEDIIEDDELGGNEELIEAEENGNILKEVYQMKETEKRQRKTWEWIETEIILSEIGQKAEDEKMEVTQEALRYCGNNFEAANDAHGQTEKRQRKTWEWIEPEIILSEIDQKAEDEKMEVIQEALRYCGDNFEAANDAHGQGEFENQSRTLEGCRHEENNDGEEVTPEVLVHEANGGIMEVVEASFECKENGNESKVVEVANDLEETELFETSGLAQGCLELNEIKKQVKDTIEALAFDKSKVHLGVTDMNLGQKQHNQHAKESEVVCNTGKHVEGLACEADKNNEDFKKAEVAIKQEKKENHFKPSHEERCVDHGKNMEAAQLPSMSEGKVEITEIAQEIKTRQSSKIVEENQQKTLTMEEREAEDTLQKEVELEKEHLRKIDEAKGREREKEMERLAVERAIREARERAFAEARERAERAAAERANAEARRRDGKSSAEKSLMEVKLKAERAAVERATTEARERALEKALSEKAVFQARKQAEKFSAEKFHGDSRDNGMRKNFSSYDSQNNNSGLSKSPRYPNSSDHGERFDGANGESAQRCKVTLERHQRTAERAAKALAEKNMRDLHAQKEQAERDRLAEALDADIKRWSSGKERNLRALLSTLQYILGPDSGWQPMPLTDIVTTAAVKKAYRKATLFVHPDKLQQRGASIQQKYTCEKVFDLLKDAWNKFSSEER